MRFWTQDQKFKYFLVLALLVFLIVILLLVLKLQNEVQSIALQNNKTLNQIGTTSTISSQNSNSSSYFQTQNFSILPHNRTIILIPSNTTIFPTNNSIILTKTSATPTTNINNFTTADVIHANFSVILPNPLCMWEVPMKKLHSPGSIDLNLDQYTDSFPESGTKKRFHGSGVRAIDSPPRKI